MIRVPAERFELALAEIRGLGTNVLRETVSGQDVGQEFIDLEARLRNWRAAASFMAIVTGAIVAAGTLLPLALLVLAGLIVFRLVRPRLGTTGSTPTS